LRANRPRGFTDQRAWIFACLASVNGVALLFRQRKQGEVWVAQNRARKVDRRRDEEP
jgi:hypothetical protein